MTRAHPMRAEENCGILTKLSADKRVHVLPPLAVPQSTDGPLFPAMTQPIWGVNHALAMPYPVVTGGAQFCISLPLPIPIRREHFVSSLGEPPSCGRFSLPDLRSSGGIAFPSNTLASPFSSRGCITSIMGLWLSSPPFGFPASSWPGISGLKPPSLGSCCYCPSWGGSSGDGWPSG